MSAVQTIKTLVQELGGAKAVADLVSVSPGAVYMAMCRGTVPYRWRPAIYQEAKRRNLKLAPELIGFEAA